MEKLNYIHCKSGRITEDTDTSCEDIDAIVKKMSGLDHLILYFHGGLTSKKQGIERAEKLLGQFPDSGYPIFFIWESGPWETIYNNFFELPDEPVFQQLIIKLLELMPWDLFKTEKRTKKSITREAIFENLKQDQAFKDALATLPAMNQTISKHIQTNTVTTTYHSTFSLAFSETFLQHPKSRAVDFSFLWDIADFLYRVFKNINHRFETKRDHGIATYYEEIIRELKIAGSGLNEWGKSLQWNLMKNDIKDAFGPNPHIHAGTAFLHRIDAAIRNNGLALKKITFIGHSAGAIYLPQWLEGCSRFESLKTLTHDVIFLAPAITYIEFDCMLKSHRSQIQNFRMFSMSDAYERKDQLIGNDNQLVHSKNWKEYIYPSSLLYLVSGILESRLDEQGNLEDAPDEPILGMQRFYDDKEQTFNDRPEVIETRKWLNEHNDSLVWSVVTEKDGMNSACKDHGFFSAEPITIESIKYILRYGF